MYSAAVQTLFFALSLMLTSSTEAQNAVPGPCPDVNVQPDYNATDFAGRWFEYARTPRKQEAFGKCLIFEYIPPMDGYITINRRKVSVLTNKEDFHSAQAAVFTNGRAISKDFYLYTVVKTDYDNYAITYACKNQALNLYHLENLWILTRDPVPMDEYVDEAYKAIAENNLSTYDLFKVDQRNCPPPPEGPLPTLL